MGHAPGQDSQGHFVHRNSIYQLPVSLPVKVEVAVVVQTLLTKNGWKPYKKRREKKPAFVMSWLYRLGHVKYQYFVNEACLVITLYQTMVVMWEGVVEMV